MYVSMNIRWSKQNFCHHCSATRDRFITGDVSRHALLLDVVTEHAFCCSKSTHIPTQRVSIVDMLLLCRMEPDRQLPWSALSPPELAQIESVVPAGISMVMHTRKCDYGVAPVVLDDVVINHHAFCGFSFLFCCVLFGAPSCLHAKRSAACANAVASVLVPCCGLLHQ
jgi:hypothetical protein